METETAQGKAASAALWDEGVSVEQGRAIPSGEQLSKEPCAPWHETQDENKGEQGPGSSQHKHKTRRGLLSHPRGSSSSRR